MKYKAFSIRNITNMHVGTGDTTFGVVDKLVQRDPITEYPIIYSSSLKGALREYYEKQEFKDKELKDKELFKDKDERKYEKFVQYVFGGKENDKGSTSPGNYRFFAANLLAIPVRSNKKPYFMATTPNLLKDFLNTLKNLKIINKDNENNNVDLQKIKKLSEISPDKTKVLIKENIETKIEEWDSKENQDIPEKIEFLGSNIALFSQDNFKEFIKSLPVIARNNLENGKSTNLWYEEIVPRESRFYFIVGFGQKYEDEFKKKLEAGNVQIGGNASIGYGFTKIEEINTANGGNNG